MALINIFKKKEERATYPLSLDQWTSFFSYLGNTYPILNQTLTGNEERIEGSFAGVVQGAYKSNGVVFACMAARALPFSQARFQFRSLSSGRPGKPFGTTALAPLEKPWPKARTSDLLLSAIVFADLSGNFFAVRRGSSIRRLRPDWVTIVSGSRTDPEVTAWDIDAEPVGYIYKPGGPASSSKPEFLLPETVAHWAPYPDPVAPWRGMSWLQPVIREIEGDSAATTHKLKFFENGATPNLVVKYPESLTKELFDAYVEAIEEGSTGMFNAYRTLHLGGGADADVVGTNLQQLEFKVTQGAGETRIAAAAGVHPVIVGLSEGLQGSALNSGNYESAKRRFADGTIRPLWNSLAGALEDVIDIPTERGAVELWADDRDIPFLRSDGKDRAEIQGAQAQTIRQLVDGGYTPESVVAAVEAEDWSLLKHTGLYSVQLQEPGTSQPAPSGNGKVPDPLAPVE